MITIYITDVNDSKLTIQTLNSLKKLKYLKEIILVITKEDCLDFENIKKINENFSIKNVEVQIIQNDSKNENKFSHISKCKNKYIYQLQAGNVLSPKTNKFLNNKKNLDYIKSKDIYLPSRIKLFNKNPLFEGFINNNKNIKFINKNFSMHLQDVRDELVSRVGRFKNRPLKSIISVGNFLFLKEDFMKFCDFKIKNINNPFESFEILIIYLFLKNNSTIVFNTNFFHYQKITSLKNKNVKYKENAIENIGNILDINKSNIIKKPQKYYFLTYGTKNFRVAKAHILSVAKRSGIFEKCIGCDSSSLSNEFKSEFGDILNLKRGAGYWIWKHEIISSLLKRVNENDIVVYSDAGSSFNYFAKNRFEEYIDMLNDSEYGNFRIECESIHKEKDWSTKELFHYFDIDPFSDTGLNTQLEATHMIFKKNEHTRDYFEKYREILKVDPYLITDKYNLNKQIDSFKENRHDQSIFSLLTKKYGGVVINNETEFKSSLNQQYNFPFLAVRKHGHGIKDTLKFLTNYKGINDQPVYFN